MARTVTGTAIKRIMSRGLTGWEAGRLILQDSVDLSCGIPLTLTDTDMAAIRSAPLQGKDVRDFNKTMALARAFEKGVMVCEMAWKDACLDLSFLVTLLRDAAQRNTVELFTSFRPHVVSRKQYDDIVAAQREKKMAFEYSLGWVVEERFYTLTPPEAREEIEDLGIDIESTEEFVAAVPEKYSDCCTQALEEIRSLQRSGKLKATCCDKDAKKVRPLLTKWKKGTLPKADVIRLVDMLYATGQQLYACEALPEWKTHMDEYQQHMHDDDDERFRHVYAVLEGSPGLWLDEKGYYKGPSPPSEWVTRSTERALGLRAMDDGEDVRSAQEVGDMLRSVLNRIEFNIRLFLAVKTILEVALEAAEVDIHGDVALTAQGSERLKPYIGEYQDRLDRMRNRPAARQMGKTRLEQALKTLPAIDLEKLTTTSESRKVLESDILSDIEGDAWFKTKLGSLEYADKFSFEGWPN